MNQHPSYAKLDYSHREIRLLTILDEYDDYLVRCTTRIASLDDRPNFNALSYRWGDPKATVPIMVDYHVMSVTVNLEKALRHLRCSVQPEEIWVDAICINQADISEKNHQLPLMRHIRKQVYIVNLVAWLTRARGRIGFGKRSWQDLGEYGRIWQNAVDCRKLRQIAVS